jgi:hypothetical protein
MLEFIVAHQAGRPVLMKPLSGHSSDAQEFGHVIQAHMAQLQTTDGMTSLVAARCLFHKSFASRGLPGSAGFQPASEAGETPAHPGEGPNDWQCIYETDI